jgi:hypothetical protein
LIANTTTRTALRTRAESDAGTNPTRGIKVSDQEQAAGDLKTIADLLISSEFRMAQF